MRLGLYDDAASFAAALASRSGAVYSICNRDRFEPGELLRLERCAAERGHRDLQSVAGLHEEALADLDGYFERAPRLDPSWQYAYSSKVVLSIPDYQDLQKIFLLRRHLARQARGEILLLVPEPRLRRLLRALFEGAHLRAIAVPGPRAWARFARTFLRALVNRTPSARSKIVLFTLSSGSPNSGTDGYFGPLAEHLRKRSSTTTVYLASGPRLRLPSTSHSSPLEAFVSGRDVLAAWLAAFLGAILSWDKKKFVSGAGDLAPLHAHMRASEIESGEYFMQRLLERAFARMLERLSPEVLVYPFENRSWEKHLVAQAKARAVARTVAYQHSSITPRHLAFRVEAGEIEDRYLPDRVFTVGEITAGMLRRSAPTISGRLTVGVSLRTGAQPISEAKALTVLVAISSTRNEALALLQATYGAASRADCAFIVRTHPAIPVDDLFRLFEWPPNVTLSRGAALAEDLSASSIVAYSSSTVALEGMLYGRLPIFVDIGDVPTGDPIFGEHAFKFSARDGADLARQIERIRRLEPSVRGQLQEQARKFAQRYLRAPTPQAIERMAEAMVAT